MPLLIPPAVNYPSPLVAVPSLMQDEPKEGRKQIPLEILWGSMGGVNKTVSFNLQNNATLAFSQISALKVDNSASAADVQFIFPDTSDTVTIPAGTPLAVVPVFSNAIQFFIVSPNALSGDVTRVQVLNYNVPPADVPATTERQAVSTAGTVINQATNTRIQLVPTGINGTLQSLQILLSIGTAPSVPPVQFVYSVNDGGTPRTLINQFNFVIPNTTAIIQPVLQLSDLNWRFINGVGVQIQGISGTGGAIIQVFGEFVQP